MKLVVLFAFLLVVLNVIFPRLFDPVRSALGTNSGSSNASIEARGPADSPWVKVGARSFDAKVLHSNLPALVYFDTAIGCRDADVVFRKLRQQREGRLRLFYVDTDAYPSLARTYRVGEEVKLVLFRQGRPVRSIEAKDIIGRITTNGKVNGTMEQFYDAFLYEVLAFVD